MSNTALDTYLEPLDNIFNEEGVNEVSINKPKEVWVEKRGDVRCEKIDSLNLEHLQGLATLIASSTEQKISEENPLLSATLPNGFRIQIIIPPACEPYSIGMSIRKPSSMNLDLDGYEKLGAFDNVILKEETNEIDIMLVNLLKERKIKDFLYRSVISKKISL